MAIVARVSDDEILAAKSWIDRVGIGCEPASAASLAGVKKLVAAGEIDPEATVVGVLTGQLLKDADAVIGYHLGELGGDRTPERESPGHDRTDDGRTGTDARRCAFGLRLPRRAPIWVLDSTHLDLALDLWNELDIDTSGMPGAGDRRGRR